MSVVRPGDAVAFEFATSDPATGALTSATGTPSGTLARNGDDTATAVTITNKATGKYKASFTVPSAWAAGDDVDLFVSATVAGIPGGDVVWFATLGRAADALPTVPDLGDMLIDDDNLFARVDWNTFAQLFSDTTTKLATAVAVAASTPFQAACHSASAKVAANLIASGRYDMTTIYDIDPMLFGIIYDFMAKLIVCEAYNRRPIKNPDPPPVYYDRVYWQLEALKYGDLACLI